MIATVPNRRGLAEHGLDVSGRVFWHPTTSQLYTHALARGEAQLAEGGSLVVDTGVHTGRSPKDKLIVREPGCEDRIWWGDVNAEISESSFERLRDKLTAHLEQADLYVVDAYAGADPEHRIAVRVISESPWHALFAKTLFIDPEPEELGAMDIDALVLHGPSLEASPEEDGTRSETFVVLHPTRAEVLIGGTFYAGEIKKSIFTLLNDRLPLEGVFPMHCSANVGDDGSVAVFFGLSGHRQDDVVGRSRAAPRRRRRARLGRQRRLQLRGRVLREGDPALTGGGARDLPDDAHVRHRPRERRRGRARSPRSRRRLEDREHAGRVQARADRERAPGEARGTSADGAFPHC